MGYKDDLEKTIKDYLEYGSPRPRWSVDVTDKGILTIEAVQEEMVPQKVSIKNVAALDLSQVFWHGYVVCGANEAHSFSEAGVRTLVYMVQKNLPVEDMRRGQSTVRLTHVGRIWLKDLQTEFFRATQRTVRKNHKNLQTHRTVCKCPYCGNLL